jgi:hypothetical protein
MLIEKATIRLSRVEVRQLGEAVDEALTKGAVEIKVDSPSHPHAFVIDLDGEEGDLRISILAHRHLTPS